MGVVAGNVKFGTFLTGSAKKCGEFINCWFNWNCPVFWGKFSGETEEYIVYIPAESDPYRLKFAAGAESRTDWGNTACDLVNDWMGGNWMDCGARGDVYSVPGGGKYWCCCGGWCVLML